MENMILIMIDECGDPIEVERFTLQMDLDEDELEIWKDRKITKAAKEYPEAQGFYFEDRREWGRMIAMMIREEEGYFLDPDDEDDALMMGEDEWE